MKDRLKSAASRLCSQHGTERLDRCRHPPLDSQSPSECLFGNRSSVQGPV